MTLAFRSLPVGLPPGHAGVRIAVHDVVPLAAAMATSDWPSELRDAVASRKADFLAGRLAAHEAVRRAIGEAAEVGRDAAGVPLWPAGVSGSISHHGGVACAVAGPSSAPGGVGVDIAPLLGGDSLRAVIRQCLTEAECVHALSGDRFAREWASIAFAAKESLFKAAHVRVARFIGFDEAALVGIDPESRHWTLALATRLAGELETREVTGAYAWDGDRLFAVLALA